jgi:hypothetical protein
VRRDFDLGAFVASVEPFGYLFGPPLNSAPRASRDLLWRLGICAAIAMNSMIFGIAIYAGLDRGPLFGLFTTLNLALGATAVAVGGSVFLRSAWRATAAGMLHLDLPIAFAFAGSVHSYAAHRSQAAYFDTLNVFIAPMLLGRWLQERVVERNRAWLLASDGTDGLLARRIREGRATQAFALGLLWGWPCGLVYAALAAAVTSGLALGGAATMTAFGLGTLPTLLAMGSAAALFARAARVRSVRPAAGMAIVAFGVVQLAHAGRAWATVEAGGPPVCCTGHSRP